jgi:hypothetical protein
MRWFIFVLLLFVPSISFAQAETTADNRGRTLERSTTPTSGPFIEYWLRMEGKTHTFAFDPDADGVGGAMRVAVWQCTEMPSDFDKSSCSEYEEFDSNGDHIPDTHLLDGTPGQRGHKRATAPGWLVFEVTVQPGGTQKPQIFIQQVKQ